MTDLVTRAQLVMLAQAMDVEPERLRHLERMGADNLRALRSRISDVLFDAQAPVFARISRLAPLVPDALVAKVSQKIIPPLVAGRAAGALGLDHPERAKGVLAHLSPGYMADCAPYLDPRVIPVLAPEIPAELLVPAANELMRRRDYVTAARFVEHAPAYLVKDFERGIDDNEGLLRTAALTPTVGRLNEILREFPRERLESIIADAVTGDAELLLDGLSVLARLDEDLLRPLGDVLFASMDGTGRTSVFETVVASGAEPELRTIATRTDSDAGRVVLAELDELLAGR